MLLYSCRSIVLIIQVLRLSDKFLLCLFLLSSEVLLLLSSLDLGGLLQIILQLLFLIDCFSLLLLVDLLGLLGRFPLGLSDLLLLAHLLGRWRALLLLLLG